MMDVDRARKIKRASRRSYRNIRHAARHLQGRPHDPFGTGKVEASSLAYVRRIVREAHATLPEIERWADEEYRDWARRAS